MARKRYLFFCHHFSFLILGFLLFVLFSEIINVAVGKDGNFVFNPGKIPQAVAVESVCQNSDIPRQTSEDNFARLLQKGRQLYEIGQFAAAAQVWQDAAAGFQSRGDILGEARALNNLCLALQQLGRWQEAKAAINSSFKLLPASPSPSADFNLLLAQAWNSQGSLQLATGQAEDAVDSWQQAAQMYRQSGDGAGVAIALINQAQALEALGLYRRAEATLRQVNDAIISQKDSFVKVSGLRSLGNSLRLLGKFSESRSVLEQSLQIATRLQLEESKAQTLLSLGNTIRAQQQGEAALPFYQQAATVSNLPATKVQAQINQLSLLVENNFLRAAEQLAPQIISQINKIPASRNSAYAKINLAESLMKMREKGSLVPALDAANLLADAVRESASLGDTRAQAYALGTLGAMYEKNQQWSEAEKLTQQALQLAQSIKAADISYRWQWQLGRLLKAEGDNIGAINAYQQAVLTLQSLRTDLVAINQEVQFYFRESVEPIYRQLVGLLLDAKQPSQKNLEQARKTIEFLQVAELDNFFRDACLNTKPVEIDKVDKTAAIFYPIILEDRLAVIVSVPGQGLRYYAKVLSKNDVEAKILEFRERLVTRTSRKYFQVSQQIYQWLIEPVEADLAKHEIKTLVFVLDGVLRNVPVAALYDGHKFLLEKYAIALTPGLQLLASKRLERGELKALTAGLTEARQGLSELPNVAKELADIKAEIPSKVLLNENFTRTNLQKEIAESPFPVIHIATHGEFSSKAEDTFILAWDGRINVNQLDQLLRARDNNEVSRNTIELLVLSACQTAAGDNRAALGLAGVAVRAGARSTLATLWYISDAATAPLMSEFYRQLNNETVTKSEALRRAQLKLMKIERYNHPIFWSPYVLVGNWL